jgi:hypothetical protein
MDINQAGKNIRRAWILSAIAIPAFIVSFPLGDRIGVNLYLFMPWLFPGALGLPLLLIVSILTFTVYRKSRIGAVLLFIVYVLNKAFAYVWLYIFPTAFIIVWLLISLIWGFIFLQGLRGTFAYHKLRGVEAGEPRGPDES